MQPQPTAVQLQIARFLRDVVRASAAWGVCHRGEPIIVHAPHGDLLPLWCSRKAAAHWQRRNWPQLAAGEVSLSELLTSILPGAREREVAIAIGISRENSPLVTIPAEWLERALRTGLETGWRETALD